MYCIILYHIILYYIILYYIISYYIILYHIILYYIILYYIILYHIVLYYIILYYIILYHIVLYFIISYYIILYYIILYYIIFEGCAGQDLGTRYSGGGTGPRYCYNFQVALQRSPMASATLPTKRKFRMLWPSHPSGVPTKTCGRCIWVIWVWNRQASPPGACTRYIKRKETKTPKRTDIDKEIHKGKEKTHLLQKHLPAAKQHGREGRARYRIAPKKSLMCLLKSIERRETRPKSCCCCCCYCYAAPLTTLKHDGGCCCCWCWWCWCWR